MVDIYKEYVNLSSALIRLSAQVISIESLTDDLRSENINVRDCKYITAIIITTAMMYDIYISDFNIRVIGVYSRFIVTDLLGKPGPTITVESIRIINTFMETYVSKDV